MSFRCSDLILEVISHIIHQDGDFSHSHVYFDVGKGRQTGSYNPIRLLDLIIAGAYWSQTVVPHVADCSAATE